nr:YhdP family protein [Rheinheimera maricola]
MAVSLVLLAVFISVLRYSLPYADNYKHHIERLINDRYGANVSIGELSAGWQKFGPALLLRNVTLLDDKAKLQLNIAETRVRLDFWRSLRNRQLTAQHFELSGLRYYADADRLLSTDGADTLDTAPVFAALEQLFFRQLTYFSVVDSQLILQNDDNPDVVVDIIQLDWANRDNRHQGYGELSLAGVTANTVSFVLDLYGDTLADAFGQLYLQSDKLDVLPWFRTQVPASQKLQHASINFKAWGRIDNGLLRRIQLELADNRLSWQQDGVAQSLQLSAGQLLWAPETDGWSLSSGALTLSDPLQQWQGLTFSIQRTADEWLGSVQNFPLGAVTPLAGLFAEDIDQLQQLVAYQPAGDIRQLQWRMADGSWQAQGSFSDVSSLARGDIPGVNKLNGDFLLSPQLIRLQLDSVASELSWDGLFIDATPYQVLSATIYAKRDVTAGHAGATSWQLSIPTVSLHSDELQLDASLQLGHELSIVARLQQLDAQRAWQYFPQRYMPQLTREYLTTAIKAGNLTDATMLWHGKPADFPYREQQGVFQVLATLQHGEFSFAPDWPDINGLTAELWFENAAMQIQSVAGSLSDVALQRSVTATIANLFHADTLDIHIKQQLEASTLTGLMLQSPLQHTLGKTLQYLGAEGTVSGDVKLAIGLKQPAVVASGSVQFADSRLSLQAPALHFDQLNGSLHFNNAHIWAEQLQLGWRGVDMTAALQGEQTDNGYQLALQLAGQQGAGPLLQTLYAPGSDLIAGSADWQVQLALNLPESGFTYQAELRADLEQTALLLPAPYAKAVGEPAELVLTVTGDANQSAIAAHLQQNLHFNAMFEHDSQQLSRANLSLGPDDAALTAAEFTINIDLPQLDGLAWFDLVQQQLQANADNDNPALFPPLSLVRGTVAQLDIAPGIRLTNSVFELKQQPELWQLQLNGTEIASRWQFSKQWQQQGINATLDYLHLPISSGDDVSEQAADLTQQLALTAQRWFLQLPPLQLSCADCSVGSYRFGQVSASAISLADRWQLTNLSARYKKSQLQLAGFWQDDGIAGFSQFSGQLRSDNIGGMLDEYQLTSAISGSTADINFSLGWPGAPNQFALEQLSGELDYVLGEGALTEVSDQGSRLFSIFSLDSLLRKLRLDFRDVFAKGFFYNNMSGKLAISHGVAQTSNASIDGVPGNLQIQGYADLVSKNLDYQMAFSPKVTSSLPVIIAWMVNPATGLAALALDEVFQSAEVISKINFTVTGSFAKPVVTEVNRHSTEVPVPVRVAQPEAIIELPAPSQPESDRRQPHG